MRRFNLEQKFVCRDASTVIERCRAKRYRFHSHGRQEDLYFATRQGRLKIRQAGDAAELIYYLRRDLKEPRVSDYIRLPIEFGREEIAFIFETALGAVGRVMKERTVYYYRCVRINIDRVDGLGDFVELEAEFLKGEKGKALRLLETTKTALGLGEERAFAGSYIDLISRKNRARPVKSKGGGFSKKT